MSNTAHNIVQVVSLHSKCFLMAAKTSLAQFTPFFNEQKMRISALAAPPCQRGSGSMAVKMIFLIRALWRLSSRAIKSVLKNGRFSEF